MIDSRPAIDHETSRKPVTTKPPEFPVARFLLDGPILPSIIETLPLAELVRRALMGRFRRIKEADAEYARIPSLPVGYRISARVFSGKDDDGNPLRNDQGAFFLPADEDGDGRIDHVTVHAPSGFGVEDPDELRALDSLRTLRFNDSELSLRLVGLSTPADFARAPTLGPARTWTSATPFLVTRHLKRRGRKRDPREWFDHPDGLDAFVRQVLREALARRGLPEPEIEGLAQTGTPPRRPLEFRLFRNKRGDDGSKRRRGLFRIRFPSRVTGPLALGHSCHFGLGLFLPSRDDEPANSQARD